MTLVAVINSSEDAIAAIAMALEDAGFATRTAHVSDFRDDDAKLAEFLAGRTDIVLWDVAWPYSRNWEHLQRVRPMLTDGGRRLLVTTTNREALDRFVGSTDAIEILSKPFSIDALIASIKDLEKPRPAAN